MKLAVATALVLIASAAHAGPIEVERTPDAVTITIDGVVVDGTPRAGADRIDIPLAVGLAGEPYVRLDDPLIRKVEVDADAPRVRLKLRTGARRAKAVAAGVTITQLDGALRITVPRTARAAPPPAVTAAAGSTTADAGTPAADAPTAAPAPVVAVAPAVAPAAAPAAVAAEPAAAPTVAPPLTGARSTSFPWTSLALLGGLAAAAAAVLHRRRNRGAVRPARTLEVQSQMSLGGKSRLVLLAAHDRELLVAVDPKGVRLLDSWARDPSLDPDPSGDRADGHGRGDAAGDGELDPIAPATLLRPSSSVSGLLRLRRTADATSPPAADPARDDDDVFADESWARSLAASLRAKRSPS